MRKTGRPTKYRPEMPALLLDYFRETTELRRKLPFFSVFAREIADVSHDTLLEWTSLHEEFSEAYKKAKDMQKEFLIEQGLEGKYNTAFAIFTAKNITDMRDVQETKNQTDLNLTGLEKLTDEQLDAFIKKFQNPTGKGAVREGEAHSSGTAKVRIAA